ncbi:probable protein phosphatase 2C 34 [Benincasa hispida]|uniref:probable protein phosphatase 2C 34 n=1 Tax=Benincasa hispida TaxID=102211 RepID=UPI0019002D4A|nr:probable protein phosphatase 2C 34 [Benincasa hispida]
MVVPKAINELIPQKTVIGWWICMDYHKLNAATKKNHFPLLFIDQMLDRLAENDFYYFLDEYASYNQIMIASEDQEKTTFTCSYGTFAFWHMPFGLCNAPSTFQRGNRLYIEKAIKNLFLKVNELTKSLTPKKRRNSENASNVSRREVAEAMAKSTKKKDLIIHGSVSINIDGSSNFVSSFSKRVEKGVNQDCCIVWEEFGYQKDMIFCGVFDGHGPWGHFVAKKVRELMPTALLCNWQEAVVQTSLCPHLELNSSKTHLQFNLWEHSYIEACAMVDQELERHRKIDTFHSGTTALSIVRQGDILVIANLGDSRAVLATTSNDGNPIPSLIQFTVDFKPNLPQEVERITQCNGRVFCLRDEPGTHRIWLSDEETPGLSMSRSFGDFCIKNFGLISMPDVTQRSVTNKDLFVVLATDGIWDAVSNQEAVQIVHSTIDREKSARRLVEYATRAWKRKRPRIAADDMSVIVLYLHSAPLHQQSFGIL